MPLLFRIAREPLVHFLLIGIAIFVLAAHGGKEQATPPRDRIVITEGRLQQLVQIFAKTWQRPPTPRELRSLIDAHIKEEVYYREALKLGLDRNDTLIRRRMQQKMVFLTEPPDEVLKASDADLEAYLAANRSEFRIEAKAAFEQIFIDPTTSKERLAERIKKLKATASSATDVSGLGDPTLLPHAMPIASASLIDRNFGRGFAKQLMSLPLNKWHGPIRSSYGLHLVRVTRRQKGYDPPLNKVRAAVEQRWRSAKRETYQQAEYQRLREKYDVVVPQLGAGKQAARPTP